MTMEWISMDDGSRLFVRRWEAKSGGPEIKAVLNIVHGMAEHSERYARLAEKLRQSGIEVWAADMRGHGKTSAEGGNKPGSGGILGHCSDKKSLDRVCDDVDAVNKLIKKERPDIPLFLMGHSWGSFVVQYYIETEKAKNRTKLSGCILSGSRGKGGAELFFGYPVLSMIAFFKGKRRASPLAKALADGPYSKPFKPLRTEFDWLSRDEREVDLYVDDPFCGQLCSSGFYRDLAGTLKKIHRKNMMKNIRCDLPVYVFSGSADPVGDMGTSPTALVASYRELGINDLEFVLYPEARHETLNETNREEVSGNLLSWLERHC